MSIAHQLIPSYPIDHVCRALSISRATVYRCAQIQRGRRNTTSVNACDSEPGQSATLYVEDRNTRGSMAVADAIDEALRRSACNPTRLSPRALTEQERAKIVQIADCDRFQDVAVSQLFYTLLDQGQYLGSLSTFYRVLGSRGQVQERRRQKTHRAYAAPELMATAPNQLWSWDITKLRGPAKLTYYYLYVILDVFSRCCVGWMIAYQECADLAAQLIQQACEGQQITEGQLTIHADRGSAMTSKTVAQLLSDLGVAKSHSRPHVSNDNPFSEAQFKTLKYAPSFPDRFGSIQDARQFLEGFFSWYNNEHHHSGIAWLTPADLHYGRADHILKARHQVMTRAYDQYPERFVRKQPKPQAAPQSVWINPPSSKQADTTRK